MPLVVLAVGLLAVVALWPVVSYNRFARQRQAILSAWGTIDAELDRRHQLLPHLVQAVQAAAAHERDVLTRLAAADARTQAARAGTTDLAGADAELTEAVGRVMALRESYPALNAQANFLALQQQMSLIEDRIAAARRFYNTRVVAYNERVDGFPSAVVARNRGFVKAAYFGD